MQGNPVFGAAQYTWNDGPNNLNALGWSNPFGFVEEVSFVEDKISTIPAAFLLGNDTDVDSGSLSINSVASTSANGGTVTLLANGNVQYHSAANYNGTDSFTYTVKDASNAVSGTATVTFNVAAVNDAPAAAAASILVNSGSLPALGAILEYVADTDGGDTFSIVSVANASHGTVALNGGNPTFTPDAGTASFKYWISDAASPAAPGTFGAAVNYAGGTYPQAVTIADLNADGKMDLLTSNYTTHSVSVMYGNGDGTFQAPGSLLAGTNASTPVVVADFTGDGKVDIAVGNYGSDNVSVWLNNGDNTFSSATNYSAGDGPEGLVSGDVNNDGKVDLVVSNYDAGTVSVLRGNGDGTFQSPQNLNVGSNPYQSALGDIDGDGDLDIAVGNNGASNASVLLGNGNGTFQSAVNYTTGANPNAVALADVNGDGELDLISANGGGQTVSVLLGNGDGTFQAQATYAVGDRTKGIAIGDLNQDGKLDIAVGNSRDPGLDPAPQTNSVSVLFGNGNGTFQSAVSYDTGYDTYGVAIGDLNGDGRPDLAAPNELSDDVSVLLNNSAGGTQSSATANLTVQAGTTIAGTAGNDIIVSSALNQTLTGNGGADNFVFTGSFGDDTITDFAVGTDQLSFDNGIFADVTALLAATTDDNGNAVITNGVDTVTIANVTKAQLAAHTSDLHLI